MNKLNVKSEARHWSLSSMALGGLAVIGLVGTMLIPQNLFAEEVTEADSLGEMFSEGSAYLTFRYRYEFVDQDDFMKDANALTMRTRLGYDTAQYMGLQAHVEVEDVHPTGNDNFNSTTNDKTQYPVVADPQGTEINQAYASYHDISDTVVMGGRFRHVLDNQRFVGDVGWRQNNQTYDGAGLFNNSIEDVTLHYGWVSNVNRINGEDHPLGDVSAEVHLFNAKYSGCDLGNFVAFAYLLDIEDIAPVSSATYGARFDGSSDLNDDLALVYDLSYAYQEDYEDNPTSYDAAYYNAEGGLAFSGFTAKVGYESLGSDDGAIGFSTPLATLHKFNGWADKFLSTPDNGLQDFYGVLGYKFEDVNDFLDGTKVTAVYHDFSAEEGSDDYGTEWDVAVQHPVSDEYWVGLKYAQYDADTFATDTQKVMVSLGAEFRQ